MRLTSIAAVLVTLLTSVAVAHAADEIHWTIMGPTSVSFDWRGPESSIAYGPTPTYGQSTLAVTPNPLPFSSAGPFWEARLTGLAPDALYHYSIGGGTDHTFRTPRRPGQAGFTVYVEADIGSTADYFRAGIIQNMIGADPPTFALLVGDLTYGNSNGAASVDQHFNDVMAWSLNAAYMPAWGNHEYELDAYADDFRNYKGRFDLPHPQTSPNAPQPGGIGEDWYWFDYGNTRFITYPEPFSGAIADWAPRASALMDTAQRDTNITFIVTLGHRPAYSSGHHPGSATLKGYLDAMGTAHSKYVLNLCGHSHDYERTYPQHGVIHITAGGGGGNLEEDPVGTCLWRGGCPAPAYTAFRAYHHSAVKLSFTRTAIVARAICGPAGDNGSSLNDITCTQGAVFDQVTIKPNGVTASVSAPGVELAATLAPNPMSQRATLAFTMPRTGRAKVQLMDVNGRSVRTLVNGEELAAGRHVLAVLRDGRDGARLPSGVYFCRIETPFGVASTRFAILD